MRNNESGLFPALEAALRAASEPLGAQAFFDMPSIKEHAASHLSVGTNTDNLCDMIKKGRKAKVVGEALNPKLSNASVRLIRSSPLKTKELAQLLDVAVATIHRARVGEDLGTCLT